MNTQERLRKLFLIGSIIITIVTLFFLGAYFAPAVTGILVGLVLIGIFLVIFLRERQMKKDVLGELEIRIGWIHYQIVKDYLRYRNSFDISLDDKCPESVKKEVLQYFEDIGFKCKRRIN